MREDVGKRLTKKKKKNVYFETEEIKPMKVKTEAERKK